MNVDISFRGRSFWKVPKQDLAVWSLLLALGIAALYFAWWRWERKDQGAIRDADLRARQIQRLSRENAQLKNQAEDLRATRELRLADDRLMAFDRLRAERMEGLRQLAALRQLGLVSVVRAPYVHESGSGQNALTPLEPDSRGGGLAPAFVETFGLSPEESAELGVASRETKQKLEALYLAGVRTQMNADGSMTIELKRPAEADSDIRNLRDRFARILGPEKFGIFEELIALSPPASVEPELRAGKGLEWYFNAHGMGGHDYTFTVAPPGAGAGETSYQLKKGFRESPAAAELERLYGRVHQFEFEEILKGLVIGKNFFPADFREKK